MVFVGRGVGVKVDLLFLCQPVQMANLGSQSKPVIKVRFPNN